MIDVEQTGELDERTFEQMQQSRCGNSDVSGKFLCMEIIMVHSRKPGKKEKIR